MEEDTAKKRGRTDDPESSDDDMSRIPPAEQPRKKQKLEDILSTLASETEDNIVHLSNLEKIRAKQLEELRTNADLLNADLTKKNKALLEENNRRILQTLVQIWKIRDEMNDEISNLIFWVRLNNLDKYIIDQTTDNDSKLEAWLEMFELSMSHISLLRNVQQDNDTFWIIIRNSLFPETEPNYFENTEKGVYTTLRDFLMSNINKETTSQYYINSTQKSKIKPERLVTNVNQPEVKEWFQMLKDSGKVTFKCPKHSLMQNLCDGNLCRKDVTCESVQFDYPDINITSD